MTVLVWIFIIICYVQKGQCETNNTRYLIGCDVATERIPENDIPKFESILSRLFCMVFERATHERLGQSITRKALNLTRDVCQVETIENRPLKTHVQLVFTVSYDGALVDAIAATKEISRLTLSHLSAQIAYPIISIYAIDQPHQIVEWWLILIIIGCSLLLCLCGWLILFIYYNTCAMPIRQQERYKAEPSVEETKVEEPTKVESEFPITTSLNDNISTSTIRSSDRITHMVDNVRPTEQLSSKISLDKEEDSVVDPQQSPKAPVKQEILKDLPLPEPWSPYYAGDRVEAIRLQRHQYPQPAYPTEDGVLRLHTTE